MSSAVKHYNIIYFVIFSANPSEKQILVFLMFLNATPSTFYFQELKIPARKDIDTP